MSPAQAICQEFSDEVYCLYKYNLRTSALSSVGGEIKCRLDLKYFTPLLERLVGVGYCCTQVQKDPELQQCMAWFEPASPD